MLINYYKSFSGLSIYFISKIKKKYDILIFIVFLISGDTIISEFQLVCDRKTLISLAEMMFLAGVAVGGLVSGIISDKYGRKKTLLASIIVQATLGK